MRDLQRRAPLEITAQNQSIFNQDMPDGFCSGKIDADCCLRYHVPTVEYVDTC